MQKKLLVVILCFTLLFATGISACSKDAGDSNDTTTSESTVEQTEQKPAETEATEEPEVVESSEPVELMVYMSDRPAGTSDARVYNQVQAHIAELSGYIINMIPYQVGAERDKLNIMLSTQEPLDVFLGDVRLYSADQAIQPMGEQLKEFGQAILDLWPEDAWLGMADKEGNVWGIPRVAAATTYPMYFRKDWAEDLGLAIPKDIDELEDFLAAMQEADPAGNGKTVIMQATINGLNFGLAAGFMGTGFGPFLDDSGIMHYSSVEHPGYYNFIAKMAEWYKKGYIYKESFGSYDRRALIKSNVTAIVMDWYSITTIAQVEEFYQNAGEDAGYVFNKDGLMGESGLSETSGNITATGYLVPYYSEKVADVVKFYNWAHEDATNYLTQAEGIEGVHWEWTDKDAGLMLSLDVAEELDYINDFFIVKGLPVEQRQRYQNDPLQIHYDYLTIEGAVTAYDRCVKADDFGMLFDTSAIEEAVPTRPDIETMIGQEVIKFITGVRPLDEWETFIQELKAIGLDDLNQEATRQYNSNK